MAPRVMSEERRRVPRIIERVPVAIHDAGTELHTETTNLSVSGVYCTLDRFIAPMTKLQLDYELPDLPAAPKKRTSGAAQAGGSRRVRIRCSGVVVRIEPVVANAEQGRYHVAVFFTDMTERDRSVISRFVQRRLSSRPSTQ